MTEGCFSIYFLGLLGLQWNELLRVDREFDDGDGARGVSYLREIWIFPIIEFVGCRNIAVVSAIWGGFPSIQRLV